MDDNGNKVVVEELLASRPCCLDEGFSTPLVRKLRLAVDPAKELMSAQMQALLSQLRHRLAKTTNMELECMLAQAKSAVPYSKHAPSSERLAYLALLSQLSHSHLQRGRADCGVPETRSTLLQRGVPLRQQPPAVSRDDARWNRSMLNRWKALHQGASPDEVARKIQALRAQWNSMNDAERAGEVQALPARWNQDEGDAPAGGAHEPYGGFGADDGGGAGCLR